MEEQKRSAVVVRAEGGTSSLQKVLHREFLADVSRALSDAERRIQGHRKKNGIEGKRLWKTKNC